MCKNAETHVTRLLIYRQLLATCALLVVVDIDNSCYNGLEVELQGSLQIIHTCKTKSANVYIDSDQLQTLTILKNHEDYTSSEKCSCSSASVQAKYIQRYLIA